MKSLGVSLAKFLFRLSLVPLRTEAGHGTCPERAPRAEGLQQ